jgi:hypothetical protein
MSKSQLPMPSFVGNTSSQSSPPLCYPSGKNEKQENQQLTLCGCRKAPKSQCIAAIGKEKDDFGYIWKNVLSMDKAQKYCQNLSPKIDGNQDD